MILTTQDKNEFLKAALKSKDPGLAQWLTGVVDAIDGLPDGKNGIPCPPYRPAQPSAHDGAQQLSDTALWRG